MKKLKFAWHIHHEILVEPLTEPIENRIKFIKENKPKEEQPLRLKLLKEVKGEIPKSIVKARKAYVKARKACVKAGKACDKAGEACVKKINTNKTLLALHKKECGCNWNGKNIFD